MSDGSDIRVGSVVIDCNDLPGMLRFWQQALRYEPRDDPPGDDFVVLRDPAGRGVNVSLQLVPERRAGKNRLHLDLYTSDEPAEVERLRGLGATVSRRIEDPDEDFTLMQDPEGNVFCVVAKPVA